MMSDTLMIGSQSVVISNPETILVSKAMDLTTSFKFTSDLTTSSGYPVLVRGSSDVKLDLMIHNSNAVVARDVSVKINSLVSGVSLTNPAIEDGCGSGSSFNGDSFSGGEIAADSGVCKISFSVSVSSDATLGRGDKLFELTSSSATLGSQLVVLSAPSSHSSFEVVSKARALSSSVHFTSGLTNGKVLLEDEALQVGFTLTLENDNEVIAEDLSFTLKSGILNANFSKLVGGSGCGTSMNF